MADQITQPSSLSAEDVHAMLLANEDILVVDVRRTDFEGICIKGAVNLPAQSFLATLPALLPILSLHKVVLFHCGSSRGRGPRVAGWYQDALNEHNITVSRAAVLIGGINAWQERYAGDRLTLRLPEPAEQPASVKEAISIDTPQPSATNNA
ncbi:uncharacterized protein L969DRAFT_17624 [Mixia osmundae IAM 14324]|uniref:Rhodanese domain-containing protein n=1 Tax=Mixia osmundae (strain CBS 9802 / IAM 14324 / JCM 22182 / KY 12970) TaxID=764103 RepID=G7E455_MIXOS|nr:uncharacterized protein L969DRAFT_17624 [Mixia osmundae IAM 14324]KEI39710.1 hypothetical protein L969DRAFT_17624 [Mixia osmundae IAM 14324]GAA97615.1 hypothetical protein E5Q_04293 [Mixia osmundae IAM 14324]